MGRRAKAEPQALRCVRASPDGRHLAVGDKKGNLWVFDAVTQSRVAMLEVS